MYHVSGAGPKSGCRKRDPFPIIRGAEQFGVPRKKKKRLMQGREVPCGGSPPCWRVKGLGVGVGRGGRKAGTGVGAAMPANGSSSPKENGGGSGGGGSGAVAEGPAEGRVGGRLPCASS